VHDNGAVLSKFVLSRAYHNPLTSSERRQVKASVDQHDKHTSGNETEHSKRRRLLRCGLTSPYGPGYNVAISGHTDSAGIDYLRVYTRIFRHGRERHRRVRYYPGCYGTLHTVAASNVAINVGTRWCTGLGMANVSDDFAAFQRSATAYM